VRLSDLSCASMTKEQVKRGFCGISQAKRLNLLKDLGQCLQICLLDLPGTWLDGKGEMRGQTDCTDFRIERSWWKSQGGKDGWVISNNPTRLCIKSWSLLGFIQWSGEAEL
jgi:hypothetical protein